MVSWAQAQYLAQPQPRLQPTAKPRNLRRARRLNGESSKGALHLLTVSLAPLDRYASRATAHSPSTIPVPFPVARSIPQPTVAGYGQRATVQAVGLSLRG